MKFILKKFFTKLGGVSGRETVKSTSPYIKVAVLGMVFVSLALFFGQYDRLAYAGAGENISGWAWSENFGWISFNNTNHPLGASYGVNIDPVSGVVSGHAWSEYIGWISFNRADTGNPPNLPYNGGAGPIATYSSSTKELVGWGKALVLLDDGWIKLSKYDASSFTGALPPYDIGPDYAVKLENNGDFSGWAWNASSGSVPPDIGIGWISFNCSNDGSCGVSNYKVSAPVPTAPNNVIAAPYSTAGVDGCNAIRVTWNDTTDPNYLYMSANNPFTPSDCPTGGYNQVCTGAGCSCDIFGNSKIISGLAPGATRYFIVKAFNIFGSATSMIVGTSTKSVCAINNIVNPSGECPNIIHLRWQEPDIGPTCVINSYHIKRCKCVASNGNCSDCVNEADFTNADMNVPIGLITCAGAPVMCSYDDTIIPETEAHFKYRYLLSATCADGSTGEWAGPTKAIYACPKKPIFQEVK